MTDRERQLREEPIVPLFFKFSLPAVVGMMVQALYNVVDRYYISNIPGIGSTAIGGVGITLPILFILMGFTMLFGIGGAANISIRMGEGRKDQAERILGNVFTMLFLVALGLNLVFLPNLQGALRLFGATENNVEYAMRYLRIILWGNFINTFAFAMNHTIRSEGNPRWSMVSMIIGAGTNVVLDPIFIYETIPVLNIPGLGLGVEGAAYASVLAQGLSFLWGAYYYSSGKSHIRLRRENLRLHWPTLRMVMAIGVSPFFIQVAGSLVGALFNNNLAAYGGELAQGSYAIINSIAILFYMPIFGMNQGLQPIIGYNYGAQNYDRVKRAVKIGMLVATIVTGLGWAFIMLAPQMLVTPMAREDAALRAMTTDGLFKVESLMIIVGFQIISSNFFASIGKAKLSFFLSLSRQIFFLIPFLLFLPRVFGLDGIWYAVPLSDLLASLVTVFFLLNEFRHLDRDHRAKKELDEAALQEELSCAPTSLIE